MTTITPSFPFDDSSTLTLIQPQQDSAVENFDFKQMLGQATKSFLNSQQQAQNTLQAYANGHPEPLHESLLKQETASISLKYSLNLIKRGLEAYKEMMHLGG